MRNVIHLLVRTFLGPFIAILIAGLAATGGLAQENTPEPESWRKELGVFRIGVVAEGSIESTRLHAEPFRLAISEALEIETEIFPVRDGISLVNALTSGRIEYAILPTTAYAAGWAVCECIEPLVIPRSSDSTEGYHSVLIARPDGPTSVSEISEQEIGFLAKDSVLGLALALQQLRLQGLKPDEADGEYPAEKNAEATVLAFVNGKYQALVGWSSLNGDPTTGYDRGTLTLVARHNEGQALGYRILWKSPLIPHHPHVIRKNVNGEVKRILRELLVAMFNNDPVAYDSIESIYGGGFTVARHGMFAPFVKLIRSGIIEELAKAN